jgi:hypothetical protein
VARSHSATTNISPVPSWSIVLLQLRPSLDGSTGGLLSKNLVAAFGAKSCDLSVEALVNGAHPCISNLAHCSAPDLLASRTCGYSRVSAMAHKVGILHRR